MTRLARPEAKLQPETIVALIDVVFFLLVFFLLIGRLDATSPFDVHPSFATIGGDMPGAGTTIAIGADGRLAVDGREILDGAFTDTMSQTSVPGSVAVRVNADAGTEMLHIMPVLARLKAEGFDDVVLVVTTAKR